MISSLATATGDPVEAVAGTGQLVTAALVGIAVLVVAITFFKVHPFLALILGSLTVGAIAARDMLDVVDSFSTGVGDTVSGVGVLIALGAMFGKLLADSGGADQIVDTIVGRSSPRMLPWSMAAIGAIIGLPMFFEIGLVLLMPVIFLVAKRAERSIISLGIPALAGLSAMHGFVPPHPGPLAAIDAVGANLGLTLGLGILVAIPTIVVSGPVFARFADRWVPVPAGDLYDASSDKRERRPSFAATLATVLLPVVLMMAKAFGDILVDEGTTLRSVLDFIGEPFVALLIAVIVAIFTFGIATGMSKDEVSDVLSSSLPPIAGIILIVGAGGGFKQTLIDTGIAQVVAEFVEDSGVSVLLIAWLVAVVIRLATGSATVATVTAAGIMKPIADGLPAGEVSLLVLAIGAGSVFFSHVNDAGFWLVKEYFGLSVGQTIKSWSIMETVLSVSGLLAVLALDVVI
ncbi:GntT/GntP/DsdX family permease [Aeromicrobium fastidiosum]|uniref:Gluconate transporter n=1 Tax=Aeromicrobium fastidiosum TaxID=52699 RepID=A0A641AMS5_9ACTN|nr:gluconate:H+ symporter [Aeromicrobium fastidiosum]KAA1376568.1 gluconate transporter [Aeromicrobium fastidiosum]MBP2391507.1 GntP family gluconate:H+ symporter [Aeromicrobium fastidiosum]